MTAHCRGVAPRAHEYRLGRNPGIDAWRVHPRRRSPAVKPSGHRREPQSAPARFQSLTLTRRTRGWNCRSPSTPAERRSGHPGGQGAASDRRGRARRRRCRSSRPGARAVGRGDPSTRSVAGRLPDGEHQVVLSADTPGGYHRPTDRQSRRSPRSLHEDRCPPPRRTQTTTEPAKRFATATQRTRRNSSGAWLGSRVRSGTSPG